MVKTFIENLRDYIYKKKRKIKYISLEDCYECGKKSDMVILEFGLNRFCEPYITNKFFVCKNCMEDIKEDAILESL